jgi:hypothetical protein
MRYFLIFWENVALRPHETMAKKGKMVGWKLQCVVLESDDRHVLPIARRRLGFHSSISAAVVVGNLAFDLVRWTNHAKRPCSATS